MAVFLSQFACGHAVVVGRDMGRLIRSLSWPFACGGRAG